MVERERGWVRGHGAGPTAEIPPYPLHERQSSPSHERPSSPSHERPRSPLESANDLRADQHHDERLGASTNTSSTLSANDLRADQLFAKFPTCCRIPAQIIPRIRTHGLPSSVMLESNHSPLMQSILLGEVSPWVPFKTLTDFEVAEHALQFDIPDGQLDSMLKIMHRNQNAAMAGSAKSTGTLTLKSAAEMHLILAQVHSEWNSDFSTVCGHHLSQFASGDQ